MNTTSVKPTLENTRLRPPSKSLKLDNVRLWVDGLRRFRKISGLLAAKRRGRWHYCALGAACEVSPVPGFRDRSGRRKMYGTERTSAVLPPAVTRWLGLPKSYVDDVPVIVDGREGLFTIMDLNDSQGWSLKKIADLIERDWLGGVAK